MRDQDGETVAPAATCCRDRIPIPARAYARRPGLPDRVESRTRCPVEADGWFRPESRRSAVDGDRPRPDTGAGAASSALRREMAAAREAPPARTRTESIP